MGIFGRLRGLFGRGRWEPTSAAGEYALLANNETSLQDIEPPESFRQEARYFAEYWPDYDLDFSPASLSRLDALLREEWPPETFLNVSGPGEQMFYLQSRLGIGSYVGETIIQNTEGQWEEEDNTRWIIQVHDQNERVNVFPLADSYFSRDADFASLGDRITFKPSISDC